MANLSLKTKLEEMGFNLESIEETAMATFKMAVGDLAKAAQNEWVRRAQGKLHTSRETYVNGLRQAESFRTTSVGGTDVFEVQLVGTMPNNYEFGMGAFDMKAARPGWLGGGKAKMGKNGKKYITIPFRHSTSSDSRLGYTGKAKAITGPDLKTQLRTAVREYGLDRMVRAASGKVTTGTVAKIDSKAPVHRYLKGMVRIQAAQSGTTKSGKQRGSSQLMTFRRMSENSSPESWQHPGLDAVNLLPEIEGWVDAQMDKIIETILGVD